MSVRVALAGCGAWGSNLLRVLTESPRAEVVAVADVHAAQRRRARTLAPRAKVVATLGEALAAGADAVVLATPAETHAALSIEALAAGADVFVEKPLAMTPADADRCALAAAAAGRVAMVGHLLRYHPAVVRLLDLARSGALGEILHVEAARRSVSGDRSASVLWTLGPHDLSVIQALDATPIRAASGAGAPSGDEALVELTLESGLSARIGLSRAHACKERRLSVIGSSGAAIFDDVRAPDRVLLGRAGRRRGAEIAVTGEAKVAWKEPLALEVEHFLRCVETREAPLTGFGDGAAVVRALARVEGALGRREEAESAVAPGLSLGLLPV
jgi:predicted dehydrogenase